MKIIHIIIPAGKVLSVFVLLFSLSLTSCLPLGADSADDFDIVATFYNKNYNFQKNKTYAMPDEIAHIVESGSNDNISRDNDNLILKQIDLQMEAFGYTKIDIDSLNRPDLILTVAITVGERNLYGGYSFYEYWGSWFAQHGYNNYTNEWNYYYPNYGSTDYYGLRFGTVLIHMTDHENANPDEKIVPTEWIGLINGLAGDSFTNTNTRLLTTIQQCFDQSQYLILN